MTLRDMSGISLHEEQPASQPGLFKRRKKELIDIVTVAVQRGLRRDANAQRLLAHLLPSCACRLSDAALG